MLEEAQEIIEWARDDEQEAFDNLPEGLQVSERGERMEENVDNLDNAASGFEDIIDYINEVLE